MAKLLTRSLVLGVSAVPYLPGAATAETAAHLPNENANSHPLQVEVLGKEIEVDSPLRGAHQHRNVALAIAAAVELAISHGFPITAKSIERGHSRYLVGLRASNESQQFPPKARPPRSGFSTSPTIPPVPGPCVPVCETCCPTSSSEHLLFSCLRDKPVIEMAQILFPIFERVIFAPIYSTRATPMRDLLAAAVLHGHSGVRCSLCRPGD